MLHRGPESGSDEQRRKSDGQQQHSEDRAEYPHLLLPLLGRLRRPYDRSNTKVVKRLLKARTHDNGPASERGRAAKKQVN
jgi:hypothetical protein